jgi:hypothetical protein
MSDSQAGGMEWSCNACNVVSRRDGEDSNDRRIERPNLAIAIERSVRPLVRGAFCPAMCSQPVKNFAWYFYLRCENA